jgi:membrane-bound ClpP family serine protease
MWVVAGILLGLVVVTSLVGLHSGPHTHAVAVAIGAFAAGWLVLMAVNGHSSSLLWLLLSADVVASAGLGVIARTGLSARHQAQGSAHRGVAALEGAEAVAVTELAPEGVVRVRGEQWSAVSLNGTVHAGAPVQVVRAAGIRLEVWDDQQGSVLTGNPFSLDDVESEEQSR